MDTYGVCSDVHVRVHVKLSRVQVVADTVRVVVLQSMSASYVDRGL